VGFVGADLAGYQYQQPSVALGTNVELPGASPLTGLDWTGRILQLYSYLDTQSYSFSRTVSRLKSEVDNI